MAKVKGLIESIKDEAKEEERKNIINLILDIHSLEETAEFLRMEESEILHILNR